MPSFKWDEVVVEKDKNPNSMTFGQKVKNKKAKVLFIGEETKKYKVGDTIVFDEERGTEIEIDGMYYIAIPERWVKCQL